MTAPDQRVAYREGAFDAASAFYPRAVATPPPRGFSVLAAGGFSAADRSGGGPRRRRCRRRIPRPAPADAPADADDRRSPRAAAADVAEVGCDERTDDSSVRYREPPADAPDLGEPRDRVRAPAVVRAPAPEPGSDSIQLVVSGRTSDRCKGLTHYTLRGCREERGLPGPRLGLHGQPARAGGRAAVIRRGRAAHERCAGGGAVASRSRRRRRRSRRTRLRARRRRSPRADDVARAGRARPAPTRTTRARRGSRCRPRADRDAWLRGGFRLGLGIVYGRLVGLEGAPSGRLLGATLRLGLRLDADWSVLASFQYARRSAAGRPVGAALRGHDRSDLARDAAPVARGRPRLRRHRRGEHRPARRRRRCRARIQTLVHVSQRRHRRCRAAAASARRPSRAPSGRSCSGRARRPASPRGDRPVDRLRRRHRPRRARHRAGDRAPPVVAARRRRPARGASRGAERARGDAAGGSGRRDTGAARARARAADARRADAGRQARPTPAPTRAPPTRAADAGTRRRLPPPTAVPTPARSSSRRARSTDTHGPLPGRRAADPRAGGRDGQAAGRRDGRGAEGRAPDAAAAAVRRRGDRGGARVPLRARALRRQARARRDHVHAHVPAAAAAAAPAGAPTDEGPAAHRGAARAPRRARHARARSRARPSRRSSATALLRRRRRRAGTSGCRCRPAPRASRSTRPSHNPFVQQETLARQAGAGGHLLRRARSLRPLRDRRRRRAAPRGGLAHHAARRRDPAECRARSAIRSA